MEKLKNSDMTCAQCGGRHAVWFYKDIPFCSAECLVAWCKNPQNRTLLCQEFVDSKKSIKVACSISLSDIGLFTALIEEETVKKHDRAKFAYVRGLIKMHEELEVISQELYDANENYKKK